MELNKIETKQMQKINRLKSEYDYISCEVVVPKDLAESPRAVIIGDCVTDIEIAFLIKELEKIAERLKEDFPKTERILKLMKKHGLYQKKFGSYKRVEGC